MSRFLDLHFSKTFVAFGSCLFGNHAEREHQRALQIPLCVRVQIRWAGSRQLRNCNSIQLEFPDTGSCTRNYRVIVSVTPDRDCDWSGLFMILAPFRGVHLIYEGAATRTAKAAWI